MLKPKSIYRQVVYNTLLSACIPLIIISVVFCYFVYQKNESDLIRERETEAREYVQSVQKEIENVHQRSEYILTSENVIGRLNEEFVRNVDKLIASDCFLEYIGIFDERRSGGSNFEIYTSNTTLYEDQYVSYIDRLEEADSILLKLKNNLTNLVWKTEIMQDRKGDRYFVFYRKIMSENESVLLCRVYIPPLPEGMNIYPVDGISEEDAQCGDEIIRLSVNEYFQVAAEHDSGAASIEVMNVLLLFVVFLGLALILTMLVARRITANMTQGITSFVKELDGEKLPAIEGENFRNEKDLEEMKIIKKAILNLLSEIQRISGLKKEIELEKKDMEVSLLQKQLDPHTLYNSLSAIKYNAFVRNDKETISIVDHMTDYYRAVLNKGKDYVKLWDELEAMKKYVEINRLSRAIDYKLEVFVEDEIKNCTIVHLLLLPFVENAVIHGFDGEQEECKISIDCRREGSFMAIRVCDNGFGIDRERLEHIKNLDSYNDSYGIKNSYRRLKLVYGETSRIDYESESGKGTSVTIRFKYDFRRCQGESE